MKISNKYNFILLVSSCLLINSAFADSLGRLYTSAVERQKLEKIRLIKEVPKKVEIKKVQIIDEPIVYKKEIVIRDAVTLKGLVHRSDGKSTAWVNDSNTFEGDLESQFIQVPDNKIKSDQVTIIMPDDSTHVELRVGEAFTPEPIEKNIVDTVDSGND
ncbi:MAG: hypothetical protein HND53_08110 [Proteobacteria bacterium]|nr:hypothetical protein [Pseudomonadota bacterium]NOG60446.1 hypothetical protein [Pseudomonadota bacterium]